MKIDFYISSISGGGAENVLVMLAKRFSELGHSVGITSLEKREQFYEIPCEIKLNKIHANSPNSIFECWYDFKGIRKYLKNSKADVSISFLSRCNLLLLVTSLFNKSKIVVCDRNNPLKEHSKLVFWVSCQLYRRANMIVVQTEQIRKMYPKYLQKKLCVIENPLDTEKMNNQITGETVTKENVVISVGRLEKQKDFKTLIKAFHNVSDKNPEWKLKIFGVGNMKEELQRIIDSLGDSGKIQLCGHTKEPFVEMKKSKIFVLSSFYEGFPNVLCEAMYAGLPCVSTDCISGPRELINDGENGFLVPIGAITELEHVLEKLMQDESLREEVGKKASLECKRLELGFIADKWLLMLTKIKENRIK